MTLYAVTREAGPGWINGKGAFEQPAVNEHAAFMNGLADQGFLLFAGPLGGSEHDRIHVLLIAEPASEADMHAAPRRRPLGTRATTSNEERRAMDPRGGRPPPGTHPLPQ